MTNKPFNFEYKNTLNETVSSVVPSAFGSNNITAVQRHQHTVTVHDTVSTSVIDNCQSFLPNCTMNSPMQFCNNQQKCGILHAQRKCMSQGVAFNFGPTILPSHSSQRYLNQNTCYGQQLMHQQLELKQLKNETLELIAMQDYLKQNMCKFTFDNDALKSTLNSSLKSCQNPKSHAMPDLNNLMAILHELRKDLYEMNSCDPVYSQVSTAKTLILRKSPDLIEKKQRTNQKCDENPEQPGTSKQSHKNTKPKKICFKRHQGKEKKRKQRRIKKKRPSNQNKCASECESLSSTSSLLDATESTNNTEVSE